MKGHDKKNSNDQNIKTITPVTFTSVELLKKFKSLVESDLSISEIDKKKILTSISKIDNILNKEEIVNDTIK